MGMSKWADLLETLSVKCLDSYEFIFSHYIVCAMYILVHLHHLTLHNFLFHYCMILFCWYTEGKLNLHFSLFPSILLFSAKTALHKNWNIIPKTSIKTTNHNILWIYDSEEGYFSCIIHQAWLLRMIIYLGLFYMTNTRNIGKCKVDPICYNASQEVCKYQKMANNDRQTRISHTLTG